MPIDAHLAGSCWLATKALVGALGFVAAPPSLAFAWGIEGHHIAADIAEQYLEPETARQVHDLMELENATTLADASTWADDIRRQRSETAPWHYVDIPVHPQAWPIRV